MVQAEAKKTSMIEISQYIQLVFLLGFLFFFIARNVLLNRLNGLENGNISVKATRVSF